MFENTIHAYLAVAGIALAIYVWLIIVLRFAGKRALAKLNAFDFAVTIAFGSILSTAILSPDVDWAMGAVGLAMLAAASVVFLYYTIWTLLMVRFFLPSFRHYAPSPSVAENFNSFANLRPASPLLTTTTRFKTSSSPASGPFASPLSSFFSALPSWARSWAWL